MDTEPRDDAQNDPISGLRADHPDAMVTRWVMVAECIDEDGQQFLSLRTSPGLTGWDTMGMLTHGLSVEKAAVNAGYLRGTLADEDDED